MKQRDHQSGRAKLPMNQDPVGRGSRRVVVSLPLPCLPMNRGWFMGTSHGAPQPCWSLRPSRSTNDPEAARQEPRPTEDAGFMNRSLFLADLLTAHEPESAGKPDALQTLRAAPMGFGIREAYGVRGFTPAFRARFLGTSSKPRTWPSAPRYPRRPSHSFHVALQRISEVMDHPCPSVSIRGYGPHQASIHQKLSNDIPALTRVSFEIGRALPTMRTA